MEKIPFPDVVIHSFARYLPPRQVSNDDLAKLMETSDEWIQQRSGIRNRYHADAPTTTSDLAVEASKQTIDATGIIPNAIVAATLSPDFNFPGIGVSIQHKLGLPHIPAYDIRNQCSGFLYGMEMASALIQSGVYEHILLVGAEVHSTGLDMTTRGRDVAVLFGDGAGSCLVSHRNASHLPKFQLQVIDSELHSNGEFASDLWCEHPGSAHYPIRMTEIMVKNAEIFPKMNGRKVFEHAVRAMTSVSRSLLSKHGLQPADISLLVPHQANLRINDLLAAELGLDSKQCFNTISEYGNTTAATIPIGMSRAVEESRFRKDAYVLSVAFGSGFTWGATLMRSIIADEE